MHTGACLCGAVTFDVAGPLPPPDACHCSNCRKTSGHFFVSTDVPRAALTLRGGENLTWYMSSEKVRRGFCSRCGCPIFWEPIGRDWIGIAMGAFSQPTDTALKMHIYVAHKGDYYEIADNVPQWQNTPR